MANVLLPLGIAAAGLFLLKSKGASENKQTDPASYLWADALAVKSGLGDKVLLNMTQLGQLGRWDLVAMLAEHFRQQKLGTTGDSNAVSAYFAAIAPTMNDVGQIEQLAAVADGYKYNNQNILGISARQRKAYLISKIGK